MNPPKRYHLIRSVLFKLKFLCSEPFWRETNNLQKQPCYLLSIFKLKCEGVAWFWKKNQGGSAKSNSLITTVLNYLLSIFKSLKNKFSASTTKVLLRAYILNWCLCSERFWREISNPHTNLNLQAGMLLEKESGWSAKSWSYYYNYSFTEYV